VFLFDRPAEARGFIHKKALGVLKKAFAPVVTTLIPGFIPGGGLVVEGLKAARNARRPRNFRSFAPGLPDCPPGSVPDGFGGCLSPADIASSRPQLPPTPGITTPAERSIGAEFQAVVGAFDMPAMAPFAETRIVLDCPPGMVLGKDDLCYPSAVLRRNSRFRKWRSVPRPSISRRDERALSTRAAVVKDLKRLSKQAGLSTPK